MPPSDWKFGFTLTTKHVWDAFLVLSLLEDFDRRSKTLVLPHGGEQKDRFQDALHARNIRFRLYSQPEVRHHCTKCLCICGNNKKVWVVVMDGVTLGHPCCAVHNCHNPLQNN